MILVVRSACLLVLYSSSPTGRLASVPGQSPSGTPACNLKRVAKVTAS